MQKNKNFNRYIAFSLLLHTAVFAVFLLTAKYSTPVEKNSTLEVSLVTPEEAEKLLNAPDAKTVVETDSRNVNNQLNEKAKFLSEKNNTVEKETRAKFGKEFKNTKGFSSTNSQNLAAKKSGSGKSENQKNSDTKAKSDSVDLFKNDFDPYDSLTKKVVEKKSQEALKNQKSITADRSPGSSGAGAELATTNDNLKNIESEFLTRLNTKEYKYFGYYNRIKTQLNQWWVPEVQQRFSKMVKQGRNIASEESKITKLVIVLSDQGQLVKVQVLAESGVRDLDDAAVEAFRRAAPFPNPPKGMIESDGTVKIRWDCVVES